MNTLFIEKLQRTQFSPEQLNNLSTDENIEKLQVAIKNIKCSNEDIFYYWYDAIQVLKSGEPFNAVIENIGYLEELSCRDLINERKLKDQLLENPLKMRDGVAKCPRCKEKKTVIIEFQDRSCDEGFTYELHCYNDKCKLKTRNFEME
jgi:DNA-directed RNA polymerase subunit M/transcription elongation factor TFIIS